jgi:hypothetical protein
MDYRYACSAAAGEVVSTYNGLTNSNYAQSRHGYDATSYPYNTSKHQIVSHASIHYVNILHPESQIASVFAPFT